MTDTPQTDSTSNSATARPAASRRWLSRAVVAAGLVWVFGILARDFGELRGSFRVDSLGWLAYTAAAGLLAMLAAVPVFRMLLVTHAAAPLRLLYAARLLFVAQMLRHLPGRVWGVVYLLRETRAEIPAAAMVRANVDLMLYSMAFNLLVATALLLGVTVGPAAALAYAGPVLVLIALSLRFDWPGYLAAALLGRLPARFRRWRDSFAARRGLSWRQVCATTLLFLAAWSLYLSIWLALARAFEFLADANIWLLCASYSLAWVLGYLAMITPGGLGVREAGFVLLAAPLAPASTLAFLALFVRVWQLLLEFTLFLAFAFVRPTAAPDSMSAETPAA